MQTQYVYTDDLAKLLISVSAFLADLWRTGRREAKGQGEVELRGAR